MGREGNCGGGVGLTIRLGFADNRLEALKLRFLLLNLLILVQNCKSFLWKPSLRLVGMFSWSSGLLFWWLGGEGGGRRGGYRHGLFSIKHQNRGPAWEVTPPHKYLSYSHLK